MAQKEGRIKGNQSRSSSVLKITPTGDKDVHCITMVRAVSPCFAAAASRNLIVFESVKS